MSRFIVTAPILALAATAAPAHAAPAFTWTGFYVGANGSFVDTSTRWDGDNTYQTVIDGGEGSLTVMQHVDAIAAKLKHNDLGGGARAGFNFQTGNFVIGGEADVTLFSFKEMRTGGSAAGAWTLHSRATNLETVRARAGFAAGNALIFATGGVAFSNLRHRISATEMNQVIVDGGEGGSTIGTSTANLSDTARSRTGWTVGGGAEMKISDNMSVALTLLHVDFGKEGLGDSAPPSAVSATVKSKMFVGTLGVNFRF